MTFADRVRDRRINPARDIGVGLALVAVVCLTAAAVVARGGRTGPTAAVVNPGAGRYSDPGTVTATGGGTVGGAPTDPASGSATSDAPTATHTAKDASNPPPKWPTFPGPTGAAAAAAAGTPGSYVDFHFGAPSLKRIDFSLQVTDGPGAGNVYWSNQFRFTNGTGAYAGMQTFRGAPDAGQFLFSVWNAVDARPGSPGTACQTFSGEGTGQSCRLKTRPVAGHVYDFRLTSDGGGWFSVQVLDTTAHTSVTLGSIRTAEPGDLGPDPQTWVEYFDWNDPAATCASQPYSAATVVAPVGDGKKAAVSGHHAGKTCSGWTRITVSGDHAVEQNGLGNSLSAPIKKAGRCLTANGALVVLTDCATLDTQVWTAGSDGSLRPASTPNRCLTSGDFLAPCTGSPAQRWHYDAASGVVVSGTGSALAGQAGGWSVPGYMH
ncbi:MAG: DUF3472 domain-containing protein [Catenulispora sp.]|nr:DUF3472 domain-containing protein [Catenulispora sp.]